MLLSSAYSCANLETLSIIGCLEASSARISAMRSVLSGNPPYQISSGKQSRVTLSLKSWCIYQICSAICLSSKLFAPLTSSIVAKLPSERSSFTLSTALSHGIICAEYRYLAASPLAICMPSSAYQAEYLPLSVITPEPPLNVDFRYSASSLSVFGFKNSVTIRIRPLFALPAVRSISSIYS